MGNVIKLAGFISVNLAIINLIPIPALDGGRLALLIVEAIIRRPAPRLAVQVINTFGVALLMLLMVVVTYHDIARLLA
jgi:regulator of sigma E protease